MTWSDISRYLPSFDSAAPWLPQFLHIGLWAGMFVCTVLVFRMLLTRWGDEHVTSKAVALSLLLHALGGLWTTTVLLVPTRLPKAREPIPLREVVVKRTPEQKADNSTSPWERLEAPAEQRLDRQDREKSEQLDQPQKTDREQELSAVEIPDVSAQKPMKESATQMSPEEASRVAMASTESINEKTAASRSEVASTAGPSRAQRAAAEVPAAPRTKTRPRETDIATSIRPEPQTSLTEKPQARPRVAPDLPSSESPERPRTAASTRPQTEVGEEGAAGQAKTTASSGTGRFHRMNRRPGTSEAGSSEPVPGRTSRSDTGDSGLGSTVASTAPLGSPSGRERGPRAVLPDGDSGDGRSVGRTPAKYRLRGTMQRREFATQFGATEASEKAVEAGLAWMAKHQSPAGNWDPDGFSALCPDGDRCIGLAVRGKDPEVIPLDGREKDQRERSGIDADAGITGLVLLSFLGAGYTHEGESPYADNVSRGLYWLVRGQRADGYLGGKASYYAGSYCHGMATIALAEAYAMTRDRELRAPLQKAVAYIVALQNPSDGGWRYEKSQAGDMSVFGWQLMALKSAQAGGIAVPQETLDRAARFLQQAAQGDKKGLAGYESHTHDRRVKPAMTAEAFFCRQLLGTPDTSPSAEEAASYLDQRPPKLDASFDLYYWYYATLAMHQHGGEPWERWNASLQPALLSLQQKSGHSIGSWDPRGPWSDYGGRLFSTAMSTLCLEVYYRFASEN